MARTPEGALLTERHRRTQLSVRAASLAALTALWRPVDPTDLASTIGPFALAASLLLQVRRRQSERVADRYFREFRAIEGVDGRVTVVGADEPPRQLFAAAVRGAALSGIIRARRAGFPPQAAAANGFVKASGTASSLVLGGGRAALESAIRSDDRALGWQRFTSGDPCAFCRMIASRGPVFKSERSASFDAHDHCSCTAEPFYEGSRPIAENERFREHWDQATEGLSGREALNAFRRSLEGAAA